MNEERALSEPSYQEFIFYNQGEDLASEGRCLPFKQYAMINDTEIRIMLTETSDALYA
jgi:hypothetical protein